MEDPPKEEKMWNYFPNLFDYWVFSHSTFHKTTVPQNKHWKVLLYSDSSME